MSHTYSVALLFALLSALVGGRAEAVQRAHVATYGLDSNTASGCSVANPCRFFQAATSVVDPNGEVVVLDSGAYGGVTLTQSIALIAPTGVYAGISVFPGSNGVTIATAGVNVVLRGLTINGQGGNAGISMTAGASLSVEDCVIANFSDPGSGIYVATAAKVRIIETLLRNNAYGIRLQGGAVGDLSRVTVFGSSLVGIAVFGNTAGTTTTVTISDTTISGGDLDGIEAVSNIANANVRVSVIRSTVTSNTYVGILVSTSTASTVLLTLSESLVTRNGTGLVNSANAGSTLESLGNNTVRQNTANTVGTITGVPLL